MKTRKNKVLNTPNHLSSVLEKSAYPFAKLSAQLKKNIELNNLVSPLIKQHTSVNAQITRYHQGVLEVSVEAQSIANHMYYVKSILVTELQNIPELKDITDIVTFVYTPNTKVTMHQKNYKHTSLENNTSKKASNTDVVSEKKVPQLTTYTANQRLKASLEKLNQTLKRNAEDREN